MPLAVAGVSTLGRRRSSGRSPVIAHARQHKVLAYEFEELIRLALCGAFSGEAAFQDSLGRSPRKRKK